MVLILLTVATVASSVAATLRRYAPANIALRRIQTHRRYRWALAIGLAGTAFYAATVAVAVALIDAGASPVLYMMVLNGIYNAVRFAVLIPVVTVRLLWSRHRETTGAVSAAPSEVGEGTGTSRGGQLVAG